MTAIQVQDLRKTFKVQKNREGLKGAFADLFKREYTEVTAVKDISFSIPEGRSVVISARTVLGNRPRSKCSQVFSCRLPET